jgi:hypothetical protein
VETLSFSKEFQKIKKKLGSIFFEKFEKNY